ncbi:MAG: inorganic phosphate transporter [Planctomycetales bacterium]|nr:inorganic phosphate transporter [Planctomycetales bacterium]
MTTFVLILAAMCLAYANGANDNFKGVATLFGSGTTTYRTALTWATVTTLLGSLAAVVLAQQLTTNFSGRGLVGDALVADPRFLAAVGLGSGGAVLLATRFGLPISTTHSLVGALVGAGWAAGSAINMGNLASAFVIPLLLSPLFSIAATLLCYIGLRTARNGLGICHETCFCIGGETVATSPVCCDSAIIMQQAMELTASMGTTVTCRQRYAGRLVGIEVGRTIDGLHYLSSGVVSFARGLNDTPKIAALLLLLPAFSGGWSPLAIGLAIAAGGLFGARRVAEVLSHRITSLNAGQGLTANILTGTIVIGASLIGMPVSTTHVSCGSLFGIGLATRQAHWKMIGTIVLAWITTLPAGALLGALAWSCLP